MSWFSEIASKAEAMLIKLDQDAAQVLQNPDEIVASSRRVLDSITYQNNDIPPTPDPPNLANELLDNQGSAPSTVANHDTGRELPQRVPQSGLQDQEKLTTIEATHVDNIKSDGTSQAQKIATKRVNNESSTQNSVTGASTHPRSNQNNSSDRNNGYSRKFKIQANKRNLFGATNDRDKRQNQQPPMQQNYDRLADLGKSPSDIRDSINKSLREYTRQTSLLSYTTQQDTNSPGPYTTHFDSQPNLIRHGLPSGSDYDNDLRRERLSKSPSFSINVPDDSLDNRLSSDIAARLLRETAAKRRSPFYELLNRLSDPDRQSVLIDQLKSRLRRAKLRGAGCARLLNYYFRTFPMTKYVMLSSSGSPGDLSSKVKQQQQELLEPISSGDGGAGGDPRFADKSLR